MFNFFLSLFFQHTFSTFTDNTIFTTENLSDINFLPIRTSIDTCYLTLDLSDKPSNEKKFLSTKIYKLFQRGKKNKLVQKKKDSKYIKRYYQHFKVTNLKNIYKLELNGDCLTVDIPTGIISLEPCEFTNKNQIFIKNGDDNKKRKLDPDLKKSEKEFYANLNNGEKINPDLSESYEKFYPDLDQKKKSFQKFYPDLNKRYQKIKQNSRYKIDCHKYLDSEDISVSSNSKFI